MVFIISQDVLNKFENTVTEIIKSSVGAFILGNLERKATIQSALMIFLYPIRIIVLKKLVHVLTWNISMWKSKSLMLLQWTITFRHEFGIFPFRCRQLSDSRTENIELRISESFPSHQNIPLRKNARCCLHFFMRDWMHLLWTSLECGKQGCHLRRWQRAKCQSELFLCIQVWRWRDTSDNDIQWN